MPGLFISFEGPEGGGKSTHADGLAKHLCAMGHDVLQVREPGGTSTGEAIRELLQHDAAGEPLAPEAELLLFAASRAQLVQRIIKPTLARGGIVVCDRFADSTTAYQGYGRGFDIENVLALNQWATDGVEPDLTLLMDVPVETGLERIRRRNKQACVQEDRLEREDISFHQRVRAGYLALAKRWPERIRLIHSDDCVDVVTDMVWSVVSPRVAALSSDGGADEG